MVPCFRHLACGLDGAAAPLCSRPGFCLGSLACAPCQSTVLTSTCLTHAQPHPVQLCETCRHWNRSPFMLHVRLHAMLCNGSKVPITLSASPHCLPINCPIVTGFHADHDTISQADWIVQSPLPVVVGGAERQVAGSPLAGMELRSAFQYSR